MNEENETPPAGARDAAARIDTYSPGEVTMRNFGRWVREEDHEFAIAQLRRKFDTDLTGKADGATDSDDRCEGDAPDCGPVAHYDSEGIPLCQRCWSSLAEDSKHAFLCDCGEQPDHMPYGYRWCVKNGGRQEGTTGTDGTYSPATQPAAPGAGEGRVSLTHDELQAIKDAAYRDGYERRHIEVLAALA